MSKTKPASRTRRFLKFCLCLLVLLVLLVLCAPFIISAVAPSIVSSQLEKRLNARASLEEMSIGYSGNMHLADLTLEDEESRPVLKVARVTVEADVLEALSNRYLATVDVDGFELHVRKGSKGGLNLTELPREEDKKKDRKKQDQKKKDEIPHLEVDFWMKNGLVVFHGEDGLTELRDLSFRVDVKALDQPAAFQFDSMLHGPIGEAGKIHCEGSVLPFPGDDAGERATLDLTIEGLLLSALAPAVSLVAPVQALEGQLDARSTVAVDNALAIRGSGDFTLRDMVIESQDGSSPVKLNMIRLEGTADADASGSGDQSLVLAINDFLTVDYKGKLSVTDDGMSAVAGKARVDASLRRLSEIANALLSLPQKLDVEGRLKTDATLEARANQDGLLDGKVDATTELLGLAARDEAGQALDLGGLTNARIALQASGDMTKGAVSIPKLEARMSGAPSERDLMTLGYSGNLSRSDDGQSDLSGEVSLDASLGRLSRIVNVFLPPERKLDLDGDLTTIATVNARANDDGPLGGSIDATAEIRGLASRDPDGKALELGDLVDSRFMVKGSGELVNGAVSIPGFNATLSLIRPDGVEDFLTLGYQGELSQHDDGTAEVEGKAQFDASLARLSQIANAVLPLEQKLDLGGSLTSVLNVSAKTSQDGLLGGTIDATTKVVGLTARDPQGQPIDLGELADAHLEFQASSNMEKGVVSIPLLEGKFGPIEVKGKAGLSGVGGEGRVLAVENSNFEILADFDRLAAQLEAVAPGLDLGGSLRVTMNARQEDDVIRIGTEITPNSLKAAGIGLTGTPLSATFAVTPGENSLELKGGLKADRLEITLADGRVVRQEEVRLNLDIGKPDADTVEVRTARFVSTTASVDLKGSLEELTDEKARHGELNLTLSTALEKLLTDLAPVLPLPGYQGTGAITGSYQVVQKGDDLSLVGGTKIADLALTIPSKKEGAPPLSIEEKLVKLDVDCTLAMAEGNVELGNVAIDSKLLRGELTGKILGLLDRPAEGEEQTHDVVLENVVGKFIYVPDRLGALLAPYLPGELTGADEEEVTLDLNGRFDDLDLMTLLQTSKGDININLGQFKVPGIQTGGSLALGLDEGRAALTGDLGANGGTLALLGDLGMKEDREAPPSGKASANLDIKDFQVNADLSELLAKLHPSFSSKEDGKNPEFGGIVQCKIDLEYGKPLTLEKLANEWATLDPQQLKGSIFFQIDNAKMTGSPLLSDMLDRFGLTKDDEVQIEPINLTIDGGRLSYAKPWKWMLADTKTFFTGSVGFDQTLDLMWNIPINKRLVERYDFLDVLKGESVEIPLTGTTKSPNLQWNGIISQLTEKAAKKRINEKTGGLGGLITGEGIEETQKSAQEILDKANKLWDDGKKKRAAKLYRKLEDEYKLTPVYLLNKKIIKDRAKGK